MGKSRESLEEVDALLETFGKREEDLARVIARAREMTRSIGEIEDFLGAAPPPQPAPTAEIFERAQTDVVLRVDKIEAEVLKNETPPPFAPVPLPFDEPALAGSEDIAGLSVDELFADVEPASPTQAPPNGGLADLFDDDDPLRLSDPDLGSLQDVLEPASVLPDVSETSRPQPHDEVDASETSRPEAGSDGDFELLVEDDIISLDDQDLEIQSDPPEDPDAGGDKKRGIFSRILGRK